MAVKIIALAIVMSALAAGCTRTVYNAPATPSVHPTTSPSAQAVFTGIQSGVAPPAGISAKNEWQGLDGQGDFLRIWAGAVTGKPRDGEIVMKTSEPSGNGSWQVFSINRYLGPGPDGALSIVSASGHRLHLRAADSARTSFDWHDFSFSTIPTCAPMGGPWASASCPESVWVRRVVRTAGGRIVGEARGIEPQRPSALAVELDGFRFSFGAVSRDNMLRMGAYFSMGEFGAGMPSAGSVDGIGLSGEQRTGHWSWSAHGFTADIYPLSDSLGASRNAGRPLVARLVRASRSVIVTRPASPGGAGRAETTLKRLIDAGQPIYCGARTKPLIALTFDDGPGPDTLQTIGALRQAGMTATFFEVGKLLDEPAFAGIPRAAARFGVVGDHTWSHVSMLGLSRSKLDAEIRRTQRALKRLTGRAVVLFRPPLGQHDERVDSYVRSHGMLEIMWSIDSRDSQGATAEEILQTIREGLSPGDIVLLHENRPTTQDALPRIIELIKRRGYRTVTVPRLLAADPPSAEQLRTHSCP